jgi:hypothetical protein
VRIPLQILLKTHWRNPAGMAAVENAALGVGMVLTASGLATISVDVDAGLFEALFGLPGPAEESIPTGAGTPYEDLRVPPVLVQYVQSFSVAPRSIRLERPKG